MGPRSSISGELPIDSYFSPASRTAGPSGSKENKSLKRKNAQALDAAGGDAEWASTKRHKTKTPSKGTQRRPESKTDHTRSKGFRVSSAYRTTSMPTPSSMTKQPLPPSAHVPIDVDVISVASSSPTQMAPLGARVTAHPSPSPKNTSGVLFGLPTPQTVSHGSKTRSGVDSAASRPYSTTESRSVVQSGSSVRLTFPQTPSRSKSRIETARTTPNSQRIVPSSQWFADEQTSSREGIADGGDPFLLNHAREHDYRSEELAFPSLFKLPLHPPSRPPIASSSSLAFASNTSNGFSTRHRSQNSQIEPTSQFEEVELRFSSGVEATPPRVRSPRAMHEENASSIKRMELGPPQNPSPRSRDKVTQESSEDIQPTPPHPPSSPLTPLTPSSPRIPDIECEKVSALEPDGSPSQHTTHEVPSVLPPSPKPAADTQREKATPISKLDVPVDDPTSDEDENFVVHPSPVRQRSLLLQNPSPPPSCTPSASTRRHLRISHAKLRSLPPATVELNSEGEEMPSPGTSIGAFPSSPGISCLASSYLDLDGTLPSEVEDFLDMVGTNASSDI